jgi:hypothetical protein
MLILPIKKKWFDLRLSGEKTEEYRELNPYYLRRLYYSDKYQFNDAVANEIIADFKRLTYRTVLLKWHLFPKNDFIEYRNGYGSEVPSYIISIDSLNVGTGDKKQGAVPGTKYFIIKDKSFFGWINKTPEQTEFDNIANDQCNHNDTSENSEGYEVCNDCGAYLNEY